MRRFLMALFVLACFIWGADASAGQQRVLVIHSYHPELPWVQQCDRGIDSILESVAVLERIYLDTKRIPESSFSQRADAAMESFIRFRPDVVMLGDDNALRLLGPRIAQTGTPVVFFGINNNPRRYFDTIPDNVTGVLERVPLFPWIRILREVLPDARRCLVLMDTSPTAKAIVEVSFGDRVQITADGLEIEYKEIGSWEAWKRMILEPHPYDFITMPVYHALIDSKGTHILVEEVVRWTSEHSRVPVFAYQDYAVGDDGVVGAYVIYGQAHARLAAFLVKEILEGRTPKLPPTHMDQQGRFYFNEKQLKRYHLTLPEDIRERALFR